MNYSIPITPEDIIAFRDRPVDEELIAAAIAGVVQIARSQGQSLDDITAEVLQEDPLLDAIQRRWLSKLVAQAWKSLNRLPAEVG
jgi:hypothetical protein